MSIDISSIQSLRGQKKALSAEKFSQKLNQLKSGQVKVHPGVEAGYREMYGNQPSVEADIEALGRASMEYMESESYQPIEQVVTASVQPAPQTLKIGACLSFKPVGELEIIRDAEGFGYNYDKFEVDGIEFAKGESVPERLKRKFNAKQLYTVADVTIDLADVADTFEVGDKITFTAKEVKAFFQRHNSYDLASQFSVEAEIITDVGVSIPARITVKANPLARDLVDLTLKEVYISAQVNEILGMLD